MRDKYQLTIQASFTFNGVNNNGIKEKFKNTHLTVSTDSEEQMSVSECNAVINKYLAQCLYETHQEKANVLRKTIAAYHNLAEHYYAIKSYYKTFNMYVNVISLSFSYIDVAAITDLENCTKNIYLCFSRMINCLKKIECYGSFLILKYLNTFENEYQQSRKIKFTDKQKNSIETEISELKKRIYNKKMCADDSLGKKDKKNTVSQNIKEATTNSSFFHNIKSQVPPAGTAKKKRKHSIDRTQTYKKKRINNNDTTGVYQKLIKTHKQIMPNQNQSSSILTSLTPKRRGNFQSHAEHWSESLQKLSKLQHFAYSTDGDHSSTKPCRVKKVDVDILTNREKHGFFRSSIDETDLMLLKFTEKLFETIKRLDKYLKDGFIMNKPKLIFFRKKQFDENCLELILLNKTNKHLMMRSSIYMKNESCSSEFKIFAETYLKVFFKSYKTLKDNKDPMLSVKQLLNQKEQTNANSKSYSDNYLSILKHIISPFQEKHPEFFTGANKRQIGNLKNRWKDKFCQSTKITCR